MIPELIDLDLTNDPVARVKLFGRELDVFPLDGRSQRVIVAVLSNVGDVTNMTPQDMAQLATHNVDRLQQVVAQVVPALSEDERERLTIQQLMRLVQTASGQIDKVRAAVGKVDAGKGAGPTRTRKRKR